MLVQGLSGFGGGLFAIPLLTMIYEPRFIVPAFSLTILLLNFVLFFEVRQNVDWHRILTIATGSLIGIPVGTAALKYLDQNIIRLMIALITFAMGLFYLFGFRPRIRENRATLFTGGVISGFLSASAAMGGPPLILLMMSFRLKKEVFRATLIGCFAVSGTVTNLFYVTGGLLNHLNIKIVLWGCLPAFAGALVGVRIKNLLHEALFERIIVVLIVFIGLMGTLRALFMLLN